MMEERRSLEKDCEELNEAVRKACMLSLGAFHEEQKKKEAAAWQTAWLSWNVSLEETDPQAPSPGPGASSKMDPARG